MIADGLWVSTRDEKNVGYFLAQIKMQDDLHESRVQRRRALVSSWWDRTRRSALPLP